MLTRYLGIQGRGSSRSGRGLWAVGALSFRVTRPKSVSPVTPLNIQIVRTCRLSIAGSIPADQTVRHFRLCHVTIHTLFYVTHCLHSRDPNSHATLRVHVTPSSSGWRLRPPYASRYPPSEASQPVQRQSERPRQTKQSCSPLNHPSSPPLSKWPPSPATSSAAVTPPPRRLRCVSTTQKRTSNVPRARHRSARPSWSWKKVAVGPRHDRRRRETHARRRCGR